MKAKQLKVTFYYDAVMTLFLKLNPDQKLFFFYKDVF